jgi:uncharacterized repeat protein (TIGR01451 family)
MLNVTNDHTVDVVCPSISFEKGGPECVEVGDEIIWTFAIQNTGDGELTNVVITDPPVGEVIDVGTLAAGEWYNFTYTTVAETCDDVTNFAYVTAEGECGAMLNVTDDHTVEVVCPGLSFEKGGPECVEVGDEIIWTFAIQNTGDCELTDVTVTDPPVGEVIDVGTLAAGEWYNFTYTTVAETCDDVRNFAYVTASAPCEVELNVTDEHTVNVVCPSISLEKGGPIEVEIGDDIVWTFEVCNTGPDALTNVEVIDPLIDKVFEIGDLAPGECVEFNYTTVAVRLGLITNEAFAVADGPCETSLNVSDDHTVDVKIGDKRIEISLEKSGPNMVPPGAEIIWRFTVCNTGDVPLSNVSVEDPFFGIIFEYVGTLEIGECWEFNYTTTANITEGWICNEATAFGWYFEEQRNDTDDHCVEVKECILNCLEVTKTGPAEVYPGDVITYVITVKNIAGSPLANIHIVDPMLGVDQWIWCLDPCETYSMKVTYMVPADWNWCDDGEFINNTVFVDAWCCNMPCYGEASWSVHINVDCIIDIEKIGPTDAEPGEVIEYTLIVKNVGKCRLICVEAFDPMLMATPWEIGELQPCEEVRMTFAYRVPADWNWCDDGDWLYNTATAEGYCCCEEKWVCDDDTWRTYIETCCILEVDKVADKEYAEPGDTIMYTITVKNTGSCSIGCISVSDPMIGLYEYIPCLCPCESRTFFVNYTVDPDWHYCTDGEILYNEVYAEGYCCCELVSDSDWWDVYIDDPCDIEIYKYGPSIISPGEEVTFTFQVCNMGYEPLGCVEVTDSMLGFIAEIEYLPACTCQWFNVTYTLPADWCCFEDGFFIDNTANASGWCCGNFVWDEDSHRTSVDCPCCIDIEATGPAEICPDTWISYNVSVTNCGDMVLVDVHVTDILTGLDELICVLNPGETVEFTTNSYYVGPCVSPDCGPYDLRNTFFADGYCCPCEYNVTDDDMVVTHVKGCCDIEVTKMGPRSAEPGETVTWTITVMNAGCFPLQCVEIEDRLDGILLLSETIETLAPGETATFEVSWTVPADWSYCIDGTTVTDTVKVKAFCCECEIWVEDTTFLSLRIFDLCDLRIEKRIIEETNGDEEIKGGIPIDISECHDCFWPGEIITYEITVMNHGENPITCIEVWDPMLGWNQMICCLEPCESMTFYVDWMVPCDWNFCEDGEWFNNTVYAEGCCCDTMVEAQDFASAYICTCCSVEVFKSGPETASPGETVTYEIMVHNTGKKPLCCLRVLDVLGTMVNVPTFTVDTEIDPECMPGHM